MPNQEPSSERNRKDSDERPLAIDDQPAAGGTLNFDDDDLAHPRGKVTSTGRAWDDKRASDAGDLGGSPGAGLSDRNGPSDPDARKQK